MRNDLNIAHKTIVKDKDSEGQRAQHTTCLKTQTNTHANMFISYKTPVLAKPWLSVVNIKYSKAWATFTFTSTKLNFKTREL